MVEERGVYARLSRQRIAPPGRRPSFAADAERIVATQIYPVWKKAIGLLQPLEARATDDAGLWRFKGVGDAVYAEASGGRFTTTTI